MYMSDYSLERFAKAYLHEREIDAVRIHRLSVAAGKRRGATGPGPFMSLLAWWLRLTALLLRYPVNPVRVSARLAAIGMPATLLAGNRGAKGYGNGGR